MEVNTINQDIVWVETTRALDKKIEDFLASQPKAVPLLQNHQDTVMAT